jgi:RND family efflux transporter MFP subunit
VTRVNADIGTAVKGPKYDAAGKVVEPGEVLAELAIPETEEEAREKQALVRQAEAEVEQARKARASAEANVEVAGAAVVEARAGLTRADALYARGASQSKRVAGLVRGKALEDEIGEETENQFLAATAARDEARARVASAQAAVRKAEADRDKAAADVAAAEARHDVAKAVAARLQALLGYTKIHAPFDGVVTRRHVNTGDLLPATPGKEGIFAVVRSDPVRAVIEVPEADAGLVAEGSEVRLTFPVLGGAEVVSTIKRTSWDLEPGSRTMRAEADLPNKDRRLRPGTFLTARVTAKLPEAWVVPAAAVTRQGDAAACFFVEGGKAVRVPVQVGRGDGQLIEVRKWKKPGPADEWADFTGKEPVAANAANLADGQSVQVK